ncbi:MAG: hypothetical protein ABSB14_09010 [Candidatus Sulfotelmatobacter sp.]
MHKPLEIDGQDDTFKTAGAVSSVPQNSAGRGRIEYRPSANRSLRIRIGGWIANLFSWYRY